MKNLSILYRQTSLNVNAIMSMLFQFSIFNTLTPNSITILLWISMLNYILLSVSQLLFIQLAVIAFASPRISLPRSEAFFQ